MEHGGKSGMILPENRNLRTGKEPNIMDERKQTELLTVKTVFRSNTVYRTEEKQIDVYADDTQHLDDPRYLSLEDPDPNAKPLYTAFYLHDLEHITLDFGGAVLCLHGKLQPFVVDRCRDITIQNVTVKYERAPYTEFDVVKNTGNELWVHMKPDFPCRVENGYLIPYGKEWENRTIHAGCMFLQGFDSKTGEGKGLTIVTVGEKPGFDLNAFPWEVKLLHVREEGGCIVFSGAALPDSWGEGTTVAFAHESRNVTSALLCASEDVALRNYRILNGHSFGIMGMHTKNITLDRLILRYDEKSQGVVSNGADAIHLVASSGYINMENCEIGGMIDDAMNIHSNYFITERVTPDGILAKKSSGSHVLNAYYQFFGEGDKIGISYGNNLKRKAELTVTGWETVDGWHVFLKTDRTPPADIMPGDLIENLSAQPEVHIRNCDIGHANTHMRIQSRAPSVIENCKIALPILLSGDWSFWYESSPIGDLTVSDCRFCGEAAKILCCPEIPMAEEVPYYHEKLTVRNCVFDTPYVVYGQMLKTLVFKGNRCTDGSDAKYYFEDKITEITE